MPPSRSVRAQPIPTHVGIGLRPAHVAHVLEHRPAVPFFELHSENLFCAGGALSIAQLTSGTDITRQAVTKHLQVLAEAGLVRDVRQGRERLWELQASRLDEARRSLDAIAAQWDQALQRLKTTLET